MKYLTVLHNLKSYVLVMLICLTGIGLSAQDEEERPLVNELYVGFTTGIFGATNFEGNPPFEVNLALYIGPTWVHNNWGFTPFYNIGGNSIGVFATYTFTEEFGGYLIIDDALDSNFGIYGVGLTTPLVVPYVQGFVEVGGSYGNDPKPSLLLGMWISFGKKVTDW